MTDHTPAPRAIPADKVKAVADWLLQEEMANGGLDEKIDPQLAARAQMCWEARAKLAALLRPTLADMPPQERAACRTLQADVEGRSGRYVIAAPYDSDADVALIGPDWEFDWIAPEQVTPRPDLPRMELPGDTPNTGPKITFATPAPTAPTLALPDGWLLAHHQKHGQVIVTRPDPDVNGNVVIICPAPHLITRAALTWCDRDKLTFLDTDQEDDQ